MARDRGNRSSEKSIRTIRLSDENEDWLARKNREKRDRERDFKDKDRRRKDRGYDY